VLAREVIEVRHLDLADLDSVRAFADRMHADHTRLDVLVNNTSAADRACGLM
jgi:NAD(P)-dependent dehydrogenase (short-subunit alcohol dehydrogenase family)